jgi:hypothetical protein
MKTMTCKQLGGACDLELNAGTFDDIVKLSKAHTREMIDKGDQPHVKAMHEMYDLMQSAEGFNEWMEQKRQEFEELPDIDILDN